MRKITPREKEALRQKIEAQRQEMKKRAMESLTEVSPSSRRMLWAVLCAEMGDEFIEGGLLRNDEVRARVEGWLITLDTYTRRSSSGEGGFTSITYTRMRAPFVSRDKFRFTIYRQGVFGRLRKLLGLQDIQVGYPEFDRDFTIKGNDEFKVRALFANPKIRQLIGFQPSIYLWVKRHWRSRYELYFTERGVIISMERLKSLFDLFGETLNQLRHIGSAE
jgi:hypothetical protein